jgi:predicted nucleic acid-binding protein
MKVLLDTCIVLDMLLARSPWDSAALKIWQLGRAGQIECCISATTVTDIYYIGRRIVGVDKARSFILTCLDEATIVSVDLNCLRIAFDLGLTDYEDAVQAACVRQNNIDLIVTRDEGFESISERVTDPDQFLAQLAGPGH